MKNSGRNSRHDIYRLYKDNLPDIIRSEESVKTILDDRENHIIRYEEGGKLAGGSVINGNTIYLLCVDKPFQRRGIGSALLSESEAVIYSKGHDKVVLGAGNDYIMPGVPMNRGAHDFFKKYGYVHSWGDCGCFDMSLPLKDFDYTEHSLGDTIDETVYRWASLNDLEAITKCVSDAEAKFVKYYQNAAWYEKGAKTRVLIAEKHNEVFGALMVSVETEGKGMGSVGCTATAHRHRNKGIATNMVRLGTKYLKDIGLSKAVLGYTYTYILNLYGRAGYQVSMEYFMGTKKTGMN